MWLCSFRRSTQSYVAWVAGSQLKVPLDLWERSTEVPQNWYGRSTKVPLDCHGRSTEVPLDHGRHSIAVYIFELWSYLFFYHLMSDFMEFVFEGVSTHPFKAKNNKRFSPQMDWASLGNLSRYDKFSFCRTSWRWGPHDAGKIVMP